VVYHEILLPNTFCEMKKNKIESIFFHKYHRLQNPNLLEISFFQ